MYIRTRGHVVPSGGQAATLHVRISYFSRSDCLSRSTFSCGSQTAVRGKTDAEEAQMPSSEYRTFTCPLYFACLVIL